MVDGGLPVERLRQYLRELSPQAQAMLVGELERGLLRADDMPETDLVLRELRRALRESQKPVARIGNPARLFFAPFEPFLVDDGVDHQHRSRISREALEPLWNWIGRDVMPEEVKAYSDRVSEALLSGDETTVKAVTRKFQDQTAKRLSRMLVDVRNDNRAVTRLTHQLSSKRALADVENIATLLRHRETFAALGTRIAPQIKTLAGPQVGRIVQLLESPLVPTPDLLPPALVFVMNRLSAPWQLIRLAIHAADSDAASKINATSFGIAVTIVLDEVQRMVRELRSELNSGQGIAVIALLKGIHDAARGMRTEIDLSKESAWGRQLASIRSEISSLVKAEVESMPGRVRRLLRPRPKAEIAPGEVLDPMEVAEVETLIGFVDACRHFAGELAINEMTMKAGSEVRQYLDASRNTLLDGLRQAGNHERAYRQSQLDAAVRFCSKVFGKDYAAVLSKAAEVAASSERKAARA